MHETESEKQTTDLEDQPKFLSKMLLKSMVSLSLLVLAYLIIFELLSQLLIFTLMLLLLWLNTHMLINGWVGVFKQQSRKASGLILKNMLLLLIIALLSQLEKSLLPMILATSIWVIALIFVFVQSKQADED
jgi:hypothetical protein